VAITLHGQVHVPTDGGSNAGPTVTITPPGSMATNDYVLVFLSYKSTAALTFSATTTGGQSWSFTTPRTGATGGMASVVGHCRYNGTWAADPVFTISSGGTSPMMGSMLVFRGVDTTTAIDVAETSSGNAAPGGSFDVTIAAINTNTNNAMAVACWTSADDNSWTLQTGTWTAQTPAQTKNLAGTDISMSLAWRTIASAGTSGSVTNRQVTITNDTNNTHILALREAATGATVTTTKSDLALGSTSATIGAASAVTATKSDLALGNSTATLAASVSATVTTTKSDLALGTTSATATATGSIATTLSTLALGNTTATLVAQVNDSVTTTKSDLALGSTSATVSAGSSIATTLSTLALGNTTAGLSAGTHATVTTTTSDLALGSASATVAASATVSCTVGNLALAGPGVTLTAAAASAARVQGYV
jgi:hypothetical protein